MANLKADLDNYLSGNKKESSTLSLSSLTKSFTLPTLKSPFSSSTTNSDDTELLMEEGQFGTSNSNSWYTQAQNDCCPSLSKKQRIIGFMICLCMGLLCFALASMYFPVLIMFARKFALLFSLGSVFTLGSFSFLWGPMNHMKHLFSKERVPFTSVYLATLFGTLYFALSLQSTVLTVIAAVGQFLALAWFTISYIPGGQTGLKFFSRLCSTFCKSTVGRSLPV